MEAKETAKGELVNKSSSMRSNAFLKQMQKFYFEETLSLAKDVFSEKRYLELKGVCKFEANPLVGGVE